MFLTFLREPAALMVLEVVLSPLSLDRRIALRPRVLQPHRLPRNLKTLNLLNR